MKRAISLIVAAIALSLMVPASGFARGSFSQGSSPQGSYSHGSFQGGGHPQGSYSHGGYRYGGYGHGGYRYGGYRHGGYYGGSRVFVSGGVWLGPGWGPWWWGPGWPYYYPYSYPYYSAPPVVNEQQPTEYIQRDETVEQPDYWYFCQNPQGYYPYVKQCPNGWTRVAPAQPPADQ